MTTTLAIYGIQDRNDFKYPGFTHDHNVCVMQNGKIIQYLHLERYTRRKYDNRLHIFIEELLAEKVLELPDTFEVISVNSFAGRAFISQNGNVRIEPTSTQKVSTDLQAASAWFQHGKWEGKEIQAYEISHELAHVFSCLPFYGNLKDNSLLVHFDGGASLGNFSAFLYKSGRLGCLEYHWQMSHLSKFFNDNALTFAIIGAKPGEHCSVAGKLMGYAAMGKARTDIRNWLRDNGFFKDIWHDTSVFYHSAQQNFAWTGDLSNDKDPFLMDIAAAFQAEFQDEVVQKFIDLQKRTQTDFLYYAGGCALNIVTNSELIRRNIFKDIFIPPCCNDSGLSIGAAAFVQWKKGINIQVHSPYLNNINLPKNQLSYSQKDIAQTARRIMKGQVIGICNGEAEVGPRALGNRSLIVRPDSRKIAQKVSMQCKKREWYRPVAPIMLARNAHKVSGQKVHHLAAYMLLDVEILAEYRTALAGVVHQNNTARIQMITHKNENPFMYDLLDYLDEKYDVLGLINTSFNQQGEPIVQLPEEARASAQAMSLDAVIINGKLKPVRHEERLESYHTQ